MKTYTFCILFSVLACCIFFASCNTDEEVYLKTNRTDAYISALQLYTADNRNVAVEVFIDDENGTIKAIVKNGVNIANLKPRCSLAPEATITPKMGGWTSFSEAVKYTVVAGNGVNTKEYLISVVEQD